MRTARIRTSLTTLVFFVLVVFTTYCGAYGKWAILPQFAVGRPFSDGLALVGVPLNGKVSFPPGPVKHEFIDKTGKVVIDPKDDILNGTFSEGVGTVQFITNHGVNAVLIELLEYVKGSTVLKRCLR